MQFRLEPADQPDVIRLIDELDAYQKPLYPAESHHGIDLAALSRPEVLFAVARDEAGVALGCGAIVLDAPGRATFGELKRMYTSPAARGRGIARRLLGLLEHEARARGCVAFALETGKRQPEALALYERSGYRRCGPFGAYVDDPNSIFMRKEWPRDAPARHATLPLPAEPTVQAPDGSDVRVLLALPGGSLAHFELAPGACSRAVRHRTVDEIWHVLRGRGEMWRRQDGHETLTELAPGLTLTIPVGTAFQFRAHADAALSAVAVTMPPWPGADESVPVTDAPWPPRGVE